MENDSACKLLFSLDKFRNGIEEADGSIPFSSTKLLSDPEQLGDPEHSSGQRLVGSKRIPMFLR
jgi:hypothetical protein